MAEKAIYQTLEHSIVTVSIPDIMEEMGIPDANDALTLVVNGWLEAEGEQERDDLYEMYGLASYNYDELDSC